MARVRGGVGVTRAGVATVALAVAAVLSAYVAAATLFAADQSLWVDETTQLSGLALPFGRQLAWLAGAAEPSLGVPPDRMPPLAYWLGGLWAAAVGLSEPTMRAFGIAAVLLAAPALFASGRLVAGTAGGLFVLATVLLAANTVVTATAIRAYPLFLALAAWAIHAYVQIVADRSTPGRLARLAVLLAAAAWCHFYGLVAAFALFAGLILSRRAPLMQTLAAAAATAVLALGLVPFVLGAMGVAGGAAGFDPRAMVTGAVRLAYRLVAHPATLALPGLQVAHLAATAAMAALALWQARRAPGLAAALLLPLPVAFAGLAVADAGVGAFDVFAPHYNVWMLPLAALCLSLALRGGAVAKVGAVALVATTALATVALVRHAPLYANSTGDRVAAALPPGALVIHDAAGPWGSLYFTLHYRSGGAQVQWLDEGGQFGRIGPDGIAPVADPTAERAAFPAVVQARSFALSSADLGAIARGRARCADVAPQATGPATAECAFLGTVLRVEGAGR